LKPSGVYVDSCVLLSLLLGDSGYNVAERWFKRQNDQPLWISHWVLLEVAGVIALCRRRGDISTAEAETMQEDFEAFRQAHLGLIEPRAADFLQARAWLHAAEPVALRSGDALHCAIAQRERLLLTTADRNLGKAAEQLGVGFDLLS
jgi:predicted nucleic acid-binding protein